jgi:hypothetical protein
MDEIIIDGFSKCPECGNYVSNNNFDFNENRCDICVFEENNYEEYFDEDDWQQQEDARKSECTCGAYQWVDGREFVQVADCICGRT